jgi:hypothetical protein
LKEDKGRNNIEVRWLNAVLPRLTVLSAITSLSVDGARFEVLKTEDLIEFFASFQTLKKSYLSGCKFATSMQLIGVLSASTGLEELRLDKVFMCPNWGPTDDVLFNAVHLEASDIQDSHLIL